MKTNLTIKNFRIFDAEGVEFKLEPITFLTGCNSSGKSSLVKAILFLQSFLKQIAEDYKADKPIKLDEYKVDFSTYPLNTLGGYSKVVNRKSDSNIITLEYTIYSKMLSHDVTVQMSFDSHESDDLNNAYLTSLQVIFEGTHIFSTSVDKGTNCNLNPIKTRAKEFIIIEDLLNRIEYLEEKNGYDEKGVQSHELEEEYDDIQEEIVRLNQDHVNEVSSTRRYVKRSWRLIKDIDWQLANESLFHVGLIDKCDGMGKSETIDYLSSVADNLYKCHRDSDMADSKKGALYRIIWLFKDSTHTTFKSFWLDYERKFLASQEMISDDEEINMCWPQKKELSVKANLNIPQPFNFNREDGIFDYYVDAFQDIANKLSVFNGEIEVALDGINQKEEHEEYSKILHDIYHKPEPLDFKYLYSVLTDIDFFYFDNFTYRWQESNEWQGVSYGVDYYYLKNNYHTDDAGQYIHYMVEAMEGFVNRMLMEVLTPDWVDNFSYVSSSRVDVQRLYTLDKHDDFTKLLKAYFEAKRQYKPYVLSGNRKIDKYAPGTFIQKWSKLLGIGDDIKVEVVVDGLGAQIKVVNSDNPEGQLLSYEGYGLTQIMSILLQIETEILTRTSIGYGHELKFVAKTIAIEEPEIHLHPRLQSLLADMLADTYKNYGIHFIVETHSEYVIRKIQTLVARGELSTDDVSLQYVYTAEEAQRDKCAQVKNIGFRENGTLADSFGSGFFDEADNLAMDLLTAKKS